MAFTAAQLITLLRADGISTTDYSDANVTTLIGHIKEQFDANRPQVCYKTNGLVTVADTQAYAFPTGALEILEVLWFPNLSNAAIRSLLDEMKFGVSTEEGLFNYPTLTAIWNIKYQQYNKRYGGKWEIYNNITTGVRQIILYPVPDVNDTNVPVIFTKAHESDLSTLPDTDKSLFYEGLLAKIEDNIGRNQQKSGGFKAGSYTKMGASGTSLRNSAAGRYNQWLAKLSAGAVVSRS